MYAHVAAELHADFLSDDGALCEQRQHVLFIEKGVAARRTVAQPLAALAEFAARTLPAMREARPQVQSATRRRQGQGGDAALQRLPLTFDAILL